MYLNHHFSTYLSSLQGLRVLIVDNNVDFCDLITLVLQGHNVEVRTASNAKLALEISVTWQPDVLISEIALPHEDGYTLIQKVRTKAQGCGKPILAIAVTGYANEKMLTDALCSGFDLWFTKPLDLDEFVGVLSYLTICQRTLIKENYIYDLVL